MRDLSLWNHHPFKQLLDLQREFDPTPNFYAPSYEMDETDTAFELSLDVPGVKKEELSIELVGHELTISGRRERRREMGDSPASYVEFRRSFTLPESANRDRIEAKHENGVLTLRIPKAEESKPRQIRVA